MFALRRILVVMICMAGPLPAAAMDDDPLADARTRFLDARKALAENRVGVFSELAGQLKDYPLYHYLEYQLLNRRLDHASHEKVTGFIERYSDQPPAKRLRRSWLYVLAKQRDWKNFLSLYSGEQPTRLQCYRLQAKLRTQNTDGLVEAALQLWLTGHSQDSACDPVFKYLDNKGLLTHARVWQRVRLAMREGNPSLAGYLSKRLPADDRSWVSTWREARRRPVGMLKSRRLAKDSSITREIILYAVRRIARSDAQQAHNQWARIKSRYDFDPVERAQLERSVALSAGWQRHPAAHEWLVALPDEAVDSKVRGWRTRTAIATGQWEDVLDHIDAMPTEEAQQEEWRYWQARALQQTNKDLQARDGFALLARERDYHGFLAADELRWPYVMDYRPLDINQADVDALGLGGAFIRARELYRAELWLDARREWQHAIEGLSKEQFMQAAVLAHQCGWHDRALLTVARAEEYDDLVLRFPLEYKDRVEHHAGRNKLDPGHVFSVIRQESAFDSDARSSAGAMGLMQLMPRTGRITARKYRIPLGSVRNLYESDRNISIGSAYLKQLMEEYDHNIVLATAAYNAGPYRVKRWLPKDGKQQAENWIAMIPFNETRNYVQRVLTYGAIYDWRMDRPVTPLKNHMPDIYPHAVYAENTDWE